MMCFVGMPTVLYGDELGLTGEIEEDYRAPMPWNGGDRELSAFFHEAIALRRDHIALRRGDFHLVKAEDRLLVFERHCDSETILVAINAGDQAATFHSEGRPMRVHGYDGEMIEPYGWAVLENF